MARTLASKSTRTDRRSPGPAFGNVPRGQTRRGAALRVAKARQQPAGSGAHKNTDEVRDQCDRPDDTGVVVTRTVAKPLRSVADGDSPRQRPQPPERSNGEWRARRPNRQEA